MDFELLPCFQKDLKKLLKRYRTLEEDLAVLEKFLLVCPDATPPHTFRLAGIGIERPKLIKVKHFACKALKGKGANSGVRLIYAYFPDEERIEFIEIYYKGDKTSEDRKRIADLYARK